MMAEIGTMRSDSNPTGARWSSPHRTLGIPDPDVLGFLAQFAGEHPDMQFEPLAAIPGLTNSLFLDGEAVTVELADAPPVDLSERASAVDAARFGSPTCRRCCPPTTHAAHGTSRCARR